jgi:prepilin-type N-terminal cleavage/methylation domain-containing protein
MDMRSRKKNSGFTLVETLVAVGILSLSILATFTAIQGGLQASETSKDQMTAFYLTQEIMEYIKNIRDQNVLANLGGSSINWLSGVAGTGDACASGAMCQIDSPAKTVTACTGGVIGGCAYLKQDSSTGLMGYAAGNNTSFKRGVQVETVSANEAKVTVTINWTTRGQAQSFQVTESLFNR